MRTTRCAPLLVFGLAAFASLSCDLTAPSCTLLPCGDSLSVTLQPAVDLPYEASLAFPGGQTVTFRCERPGLVTPPRDGLLSLTCSPSRLRITCAGTPDYCSTTPVAVSIVASDGRAWSGVVAPRYGLEQPNGPRCAPTCRTGHATFP